MRYTPNQEIVLEPEHEREILDDDLEFAHNSVEVKVIQSIHSAEKPFLTYWEVEYMDSTPNRERGETIIMTENMLTNYEVPVVDKDQNEQEQRYGLLAEPNNA